MPPGIEVMDMPKYEEREQRVPAESDAVGIVVRDGAAAERPPRAVAFVWGGKVRPTPSLPYGRWKRVLAA